MKSVLKLCAAGIGIGIALGTARLLGDEWKLTDLGTLGGSETFAYSLNDLGQVTGESRLAGDGDAHAFFYAKGAMVDLAPINSGEIRTSEVGLNNQKQIVSGVVQNGIYWPTLFDLHSGQITILGSLGGVTSYGFSGVASAINDAGVAVGYSYLDEFVRHAFAYHQGALIDLGSFGGSSASLAVNGAGIAAGFASDPSTGSARACVWSNDSILDISSGQESEAYAINDDGDVVGFTLAGAHDHAFLFQDGAVRDLGTLKLGRNSYAYGINNQGDIVGMAEAFFNFTYITNPFTYQVTVVTNYHDHAFIFRQGKMVDLNRCISKDSPWELNSAVAINNLGQILVWGSADGGEHFRSFILNKRAPRAHHPIRAEQDDFTERKPLVKPRIDHAQAKPHTGQHFSQERDWSPLARRGWARPPD